MSPLDAVSNAATGGFPRVSGDEPLHEVVRDLLQKFSPRERG